jgi:hypothetical protein
MKLQLHLSNIHHLQGVMNNMNINQLMADLKAHSPHARGARTRKANKELTDKLKRERTFKSVCTEMRVG